MPMQLSDIAFIAGMSVLPTLLWVSPSFLEFCRPLKISSTET